MNPFIYIIYLQPEKQGQGYGTRAVMSIMDNLRYFTHSIEPQNAVCTIINSTNEASQKVFRKNGFAPREIDDNPRAYLDFYNIVSAKER